MILCLTVLTRDGQMDALWQHKPR